MNENKKHCCKKHKQQKLQKQTQENTKELKKMEEVISNEAAQNSEIIKENQNENQQM